MAVNEAVKKKMAKNKGNPFDRIKTEGVGEARYRHTSGKGDAPPAVAPVQTPPNPAGASQEPERVTEEPEGGQTLTQEQATGARGRGRPRNPDTITSGGNRGLREGDTRVTIVETEDMLMWYRDYAYTMGLTRREAIHNALQMYRDHIESSGQEIRPNPRFRR